MRTKRLAPLWGVLIGCFLLTGCGAQSVPDPSGPAAAPPLPSRPSTQATLPEQPPVTLQEQILYQDQGVNVTVLAMEEGFLGPEVRVTVTNDTQKNLTLSSRLLSVNSCMMDTAGLYVEVAAGKKANDAVSLYQSDLDRAGIDMIGEISFYLTVSDTESFETVAESELLTLSTSAAEFSREPELSGQELYHMGGIRVVSQGLREDLFWDGTLVLLLENTSQQPVTVYAENVSVNGYMADNAMWCDLRPGTWALDGLTLLNLGGGEITELDQVEELEFTIRVIHNETWEELGNSEVIRIDLKG